VIREKFCGFFPVPFFSYFPPFRIGLCLRLQIKVDALGTPPFPLTFFPLTLRLSAPPTFCKKASPIPVFHSNGLVMCSSSFFRPGTTRLPSPFSFSSTPFLSYSFLSLASQERDVSLCDTVAFRSLSRSQRFPLFSEFVPNGCSFPTRVFSANRVDACSAPYLLSSLPYAILFKSPLDKNHL